MIIRGTYRFRKYMWQKLLKLLLGRFDIFTGWNITHFDLVNGISLCVNYAVIDNIVLNNL